jgi:hypothetical protein
MPHAEMKRERIRLKRECKKERYRRESAKMGSIDKKMMVLPLHERKRKEEKAGMDEEKHGISSKLTEFVRHIHQFQQRMRKGGMWMNNIKHLHRETTKKEKE